MPFRLGLIADTHGLLRPEACDALRGSDAILHAGDIGTPGILDALAALAPTTAVRGNNDRGVWAERLPEAVTLEFAGVRIHLLHQLKDLALAPRAAGVQVVVFGHSHKPQAERRDGVLHVNPGSAGPRRFRLPVTVALLTLAPTGPDAVIVPLDAHA
ncbi:MAG TPA: metallophosphoesterase [Lysobacter sp.]|nr:metallophosphoesterase [Lysobacter sp.]